MSERAISVTAPEIAHIVEVVLHHPLQLIPLSNIPQTQKNPRLPFGKRGSALSSYATLVRFSEDS